MVGYFGGVVALALLVLDLGGSGTVLGAISALYFVPSIFVGPWAGVASDRYDKRRLLILTQTGMMVSAFGTATLVFLNQATLWRLVILVGLAGIADGFAQPARRTIVSELVDEPGLVNAVSLNGALNQLAKVIGPALVGVLAPSVGIGWCFVANGFTSLALITAVIRMDVSSMY